MNLHQLKIGKVQAIVVIYVECLYLLLEKIVLHGKTKFIILGVQIFGIIECLKLLLPQINFEIFRKDNLFENKYYNTTKKNHVFNSVKLNHLLWIFLMYSKTLDLISSVV